MQALIRRDFLISRSYPLSFLLDFVFGVLNLLLYFFISETFESATEHDLSGAPSYFAFAAVGAALSFVVQATSFRVAQRIREEQLTGTLEALVAQPISSVEMALGLAGFHFLFGMARATVYLTAGIPLLDLDFARVDWVGFAFVLLAVGVAMTAVGIALSALVVVLKRAEGLIAVALLLLGLGGGAFFPIDVLPGWIQPAAEVLPTRFAFDGARAALFQGSGWADDVVALLVFSGVALPLSLGVFRAALRFAVRRGSLATY